ncbi:hypothetical protein [Micromonospora sp. DT47]|uniref:hypothetical protein n=1 Tax=Micromonospora sp. DT47 TaxID=3393431 RepID=UPI003CEA5E3C
MWGKVDVPCVGGPVDGGSLLVPVDEVGVPPDVIDQNWLWVEFGGELLDADMAGVYERGARGRHRPAVDLRLGAGGDL